MSEPKVPAKKRAAKKATPSEEQPDITITPTAKKKPAALVETVDTLINHMATWVDNNLQSHEPKLNKNILLKMARKEIIATISAGHVTDKEKRNAQQLHTYITIKLGINEKEDPNYS